MTETNETTPAVTGLVRKLADIMAAVERVPKRGHNSFHNYDYATEADIVGTVRDELSKRNVMLIPSVQNHERHEVTTKKGERGDTLTVLHMTFTFVDGDSGEREAHAWLGVGQDGGDKGAYKAMTGAAKYFLLKTFLMPTGDDPEAGEGDAPQDQRQPLQRTPEPRRQEARPEPPRQPAPPPQRQREPGDDDEDIQRATHGGGYGGQTPNAPPPQRQASNGNGGGRKISEPQQKRLYAKATGEGGMTKDQYRAFLKSKGYDSDRDVLMSDYDAIVADAIDGGR